MYTRLGRWSYNNAWKMVGIWALAVVALLALTATLGNGYSDSFTIPDSESAEGFELMGELVGGAFGEIPGSIVVDAPQGIDDPAVAAAFQATIADIEAQTGPGQTFEHLQPIVGEDGQQIHVTSPYSAAFASQIARQGPKAGQVAFANLSAPAETGQEELQTMGLELKAIADRQFADLPDVRVAIGGAQFASFEPPETEIIGVAFATIVLIIAMGSVLAMGTTLGVAIIGVATGVLVVGLTSNLITIPQLATTVGVMIGLGVGIDYALFIVNRYREALRQGFDAEGAVVAAIDTSGRSVIFAGMTVVVSLLGLLLIGLPFTSGLGVAAALTVLAVMVGSVTLLPAVISLLGERISITRWRGVIAAGLVAVGLLGIGLSFAPMLAALPLAVIVIVVSLFPFAKPLRKQLPPRKQTDPRDTVWYRWSRVVQHHAWLFTLLGGAFLIVLSIPVAKLDLGFSDEGNYPAESTTRQAYDLMAEGFGPGVNGPLLVVGRITSPEQLPAVENLVADLNADPGIALAVVPGGGDESQQADPQQSDGVPEVPPGFVIQVLPATAPQNQATEELVHRLRDELIPAAVEGSGLTPLVTGSTAANIDFTSYLASRIIVFFVVVLALSFILLMIVFRSLLVPLKAVIMNMLSISAAYGIVIAIFQFGWLGSLFGVSPAPIEPFIPMMMFAILFGLSMDYEVFLLSRIKEEFERTGDAVNSVADGLSLTARVITTAAAIMVVVFGSFMLEDDRIIKLFGVGLASAVLLDASVVRMILVPSTMQLLGSRNWWLPRWLNKVLPNLNVEGSHHTPGESLD